jgi:hypothetical protein
MATEMSQIRSIANAHIRRDMGLMRKWICECDACCETRSLVGMDKLFDVRPLVREIAQVEEQLRDMPEGQEMRGLLEQYLTLYDKLAEAMAK